MTSSGFSVAQSGVFALNTHFTLHFMFLTSQSTLSLTLFAVLWAVFSSLPQPLMAVPAFLFVEQFSSVLAIGLGFASGAMAYVALFELLQEAVEDTKSVQFTAITSVAAFTVMMYLQEAVKGHM
jgi:zinc transporter ZupT